MTEPARLVETRPTGRGRVYGVKLRPGAIRAFREISAVELSNRMIPLRSLFGEGISVLEQTVLASEADDQAFRAIGQWLTSIQLNDQQRGCAALRCAAHRTE